MPTRTALGYNCVRNTKIVRFGRGRVSYIRKGFLTTIALGRLMMMRLFLHAPARSVPDCGAGQDRRGIWGGAFVFDPASVSHTPYFFTGNVSARNSGTIDSVEQNGL